jgi:hypothetical protein
MQQAVIGVFMVHHQQPAVRTVLREVMNAVVVHAKLRFLLGGAVAGVDLECRVVARQAHRVAPRRDHLHRIALRHHHLVGARHRHALEAEPGAASEAGATLERAQRSEQRSERGSSPAAQHDAARRLRKLVNGGVGGAVAVLHQAEILGHRDPC